jgi:uncharacterized protein YqgC (DUF456 family)
MGLDIILITLAGFLALAGLAGSILPVLPGPPLSYLTLISLYYTTHEPFSIRFLVVTGIIMILITALDYWVPVYGSKKFGGSKLGVRGSTIGLIAGIFIFPPIGLILGPAVGALIGELFAGKSFKQATKSAWGSFLGFLAGTFVKLVYGAVIVFYFIRFLVEFI